MLAFDDFWTRRLRGASSPSSSSLSGWHPCSDALEGFVEPNLTCLEGNPDTASIIIVAAPGAVGKSSFARQLSNKVSFSLVDLALTAPLGGNFFKGGLANAFGFDALSAAATGRIGLVVDALDEAQLRAGPEGYEAGIKDLASITASASALPSVLFGRAVAAEDAYLLLASSGYDVCLLQIEFFDEEKSQEYISRKLPIAAARDERILAAYLAHAEAFTKLAMETRDRLTSVPGGAETRFSGYAPVLDAIVAFTLDEDALNPQARLQTLDVNNQIELIREITASILDREQKKLTKQFGDQNGEVRASLLQRLYTPSEQLGLISARILGTPTPEVASLGDPKLQASYADMVAQFAPQHPFLAGANNAANLVFSAYVAVWALTDGHFADHSRSALRKRPSLISGVLFELYTDWLTADHERSVPLTDVGILYQALNSRVSAGQRASLEITTSEGDESLDVAFEVVGRVDARQENLDASQEFGPFRSFPDSILELRSPFSNVFIDAPIWVELGDGIAQHIGAPTDISVKQLTISAQQLLVTSGSGEVGKDYHLVTLAAEEADCKVVQNVSVRDCTLNVSWPDAKVYPWTSYATEAPPASPEVDFMRRRLRTFLTAFRSHSKGSLVRLAKKLESRRMLKDERGEALFARLMKDQILSLKDAGKFYVLDADRMGEVLGVEYWGLLAKRYSDKSDEYLRDVLKNL